MEITIDIEEIEVSVCRKCNKAVSYDCNEFDERGNIIRHELKIMSLPELLTELMRKK